MTGNVQQFTPLASFLGTAEGRRAETLRRLVETQDEEGDKTILTIRVPPALLHKDDLRQAMVDYLGNVFNTRRGFMPINVDEAGGTPIMTVELTDNARGVYRDMMREVEKAEAFVEEQRTP